MRERNRTTSTEPVELTRIVTNYAGTCSVPGYSTQYDEKSYYTAEETTETMYDVVTPNYQKLSGMGKIVNNPMTRIKVIDTDSPAAFNATRKWSMQTCTPVKTVIYGVSHSGYRAASLLCSNGEDSPLYPLLPSVLNEERMMALAITQAWNNQDLSKVLSPVILAEMDKTVSSLVSIFKRVIKIARNIRKLRFQALLNEISPKELSQRWMEARYALRPLAYDVLGVLDAYKTSSILNNRQTARGYAETQSTVVTEAHTVYGGDNYTWTIFGQAWREVKVRAGVLAHIEDISQLQNWGITKIPEAIWELVPDSFVVDWFFNVGQTIGSWTPELGLRPLASWATVELTAVQTSEVIDFSVNNVPSDGTLISCTGSCLGAKCTHTVIETQRIPNPSRPIIPRFKLRLNPAKLFDLAIILKQMFR